MKWLHSSQVRLALFFLAGIMILFSALGFIALQQGQRTFTSTVQGIIVPRGDEQGVVIFRPPDLLRQQVRNERGELKTPEELFVERFESSLLWISLLGVGIALLLGVFIAEYFLVKPLGRLQKGIKGLRQREFTSKIEPTGLPEFDEVAASFNQLAQELDRVENLRRDLISDTSHELKTPLTSLKMQLEGMRDGLIPLKKERVELLLQHTDRLSDLTERLQEYARMRNRTAHMEFKPLKLRKLIEQVIEGMEEALHKAKLKVIITVPADFMVTGDGKLLEQVFSNLMQNAVAHSGATELEITATEDRITVTDNGKGVPAPALTHLFERFYRVEQSRSRAHGGLGLGLAIVREIIEAHGWRIEAAASGKKGLWLVISLQ